MSNYKMGDIVVCETGNSEAFGKVFVIMAFCYEDENTVACIKELEDNLSWQEIINNLMSDMDVKIPVLEKYFSKIGNFEDNPEFEKQLMDGYIPS